LENWLKENRQAASEAEAVEITLQILKGLENLHEKGFVHRDLKPDNILIMNGKLCLADFGISREVKTYSKATGTAGTVEYMPPEAFEKKPSVTPQTDIWAIGVILQRLLTGELSFPQEMPALMLAILQDEPEPIPESVSQGLREIVKKALQKKREDRFQTAREMREALKNPTRFLDSLAKKDSETIVDEDSNKTEVLEIEETQAWQAIEAQKLENQKKNGNLSTIEAERQQADLSKIRRGLVSEQKTKNDNQLWFIIGSIIVVIVGFIAIIAFNRNPTKPLITNQSNNISNNRPANNSISNSANLTINSPKNTTNISSNAVNTISNNSNTSIDYFQIAHDCFEKNDVDCAIQNYTKYLEQNPSNSSAYYNRGIAYNRKRNYSQAIKDYNKAVELDSNVANYYVARGNSYYNQDDYNQALKDYSLAIALNPNDADLYNARGNCYYYKKDYDLAILEYRKALSIDPNHKKAKDSLNDAVNKKNAK
ncbi:MAG TPA: protein kinase, partial [Pyrinomonadaceae bacterium]|nr:protein kinase [Pyrinomonadaceae bacterium]